MEIKSACRLCTDNILTRIIQVMYKITKKEKYNFIIGDTNIHLSCPYNYNHKKASSLTKLSN